jgi:hypothetical protein
MTTRTQTAESRPHPLAGKRMTGAEIIVQVLVDEGVQTVFGYSGGAILPTYDAVFRYNDEHRDENGTPPLALIVPANEQGAASWPPVTRQRPGASAWSPPARSHQHRHTDPRPLADSVPPS